MIQSAFFCKRWTAAFRGLLVVLFSQSICRPDDSTPEFGEFGKNFLNAYCIDCHSGDAPSAELSLESFVDADSMVKQRKNWDGVVRMIVAGEMPPSDSPQPPVDEAEAFIDLVKAIFDYADANAEPDPGRVTMRRLNRVEYRNTIRDLIGVRFDPTVDFPSDDIGHGFDNIGDVLSLSPLLMERYLAAAEQIVQQAILPEPPPIIKRHIDALYTEPASGDLAERIKDGFRPMHGNSDDPLETGPVHTEYRFEEQQEYLFRTRLYATGGSDTTGGSDVPVKVSILVYGNELEEPSSDEELNSLVGNVLKPAKILQTFEVQGRSPEEADIIEVKVPPIANRQRMMIAVNRSDPDEPPVTVWVRWIQLNGPLDTTPSIQRRLLATSPDASQDQKTREVLSRFLRRAFRRPVEIDELNRSVQLVNDILDEGESWESAVQFAIQAALCSPKFLFRVELDEDPQSPVVRDLDEFQFASRLSYFLWSSMPDDQLLDLAEANRLIAELDTQVARMLADPRALSLVSNFALQWLQLLRIESFSPDLELFPTFSPELRTAMIEETKQFVQSIVAEDRSILELIDADFTFLNEPLARHYGIADTNGNRIGQELRYPAGQPIRGEEFVRVSLPDRTRGGLLTQASVLTVTSNPTRTSPVKRGKWILEQILGAPPPPPPPNVPELSEEDHESQAVSFREQLEIHRRNPACANCHAKMDPIGFALENFDAIGAYRTRDGRFEIDATGEFSDGTRFSGPVELKQVVLKRQEEFVRCMVEKLLVYALGRGLEYYDRPTTEMIVRAMPEHGYKFSGLVQEIVSCDAFRQRRGGQ
jgi:hypothetical protein